MEKDHHKIEREVIKMKYGDEYFNRDGWNASVDMYRSRYYAEKAKQSPNDVIIKGKKTGLYKILTRKEYREYKQRPSWQEY